MRFAVFTHVKHYKNQEEFYAYAPYVREMNLWFRQVENVEVVAPAPPPTKEELLSGAPYKHSYIVFTKIPSFHLLNFPAILGSVIKIPFIFFKILGAMRRADHLHIRCPGNIGLLASIAQIFFPKKPKTVKYAGNWAESSGQPLSYRFQMWLLSNEFLSRNIKVLIYGEARNNSKNILPFFTASFSESEKKLYEKKFSAPLKFIFVGGLVEGKRPLFAIKFVEELNRRGLTCSLDIFGIGPLLVHLKEYIKNRDLHDIIDLKGSQELNELKQAYREAHFVILASKSEGWPKALAEGMFFGCIPISTSVSCVPWMLGNGQRGILIKNEINEALTHFQKLIENKELLKEKSLEAQKWAQNYTLEKFEAAINKLV